MTPLRSKTLILLITALILVQGAAALTIEQAPLNPEFVAYMEGMETGDTQYSITSYGDPYPADTTRQMPYATGDIPAPVAMVWPDTDANIVFRAMDAGEDALPASFDLRDVGRVTPVRDQGKCGSCWAFAAYGSLESTYLTDTGTAENFSENNMKNLCSNLYPDGYDRDPCGGGNAMMSAAYLTRGSGPIREADDNYTLPVPSTTSPTNLPPVLDVNEVTFLPTRTGPLDNGLLKQTLMDEGGLRVRFLVNWSCFSDDRTTYYHPDEGYPTLGGHAVTLVGWDDTFPKDAFAVEAPDDGAFILKNSWGTGVGEDGYFYISYYDRTLDTGEPALFTGVPADAERQSYQYDPLGATRYIGTGEDTTYYGANVFTAENYEELTDVSFYTREPETEYTIAIFTNFTTPPGDTAPVAWTAGTSALPGYHTISLPDSVPLMPGDVFSVVLEVSSPTCSHPLVVEMPIEDYSSGATAEAGESYVSDDGETWEDLTTRYPDTNVCIKAHTSPAIVVPRDYATIQEAVDAAESGDTIVVESGTYPEELEIKKTLTLLGVGTPVVTSPEHGIGVQIGADDVTMAGFSFDGNGEAFGGVGIFRNGCTLHDIEIHGYTDGLHIGYVRGLSLCAIALRDNTNNIEFTEIPEAPENSIDETVTVNGRPVIYREGVTGECIDASSDAGAIICVNCTDLTIRDTTTEAVGDGVVLSFCRDVMVENVTTPEVKYGLQADCSENITVQASSFGPECRSGMFLRDTSGFLAEDNEITSCDNGLGFGLFMADNVTFTGNSIDSGANGIGMMGRMILNIEVSGNTFEGETNLGIAVRDAENLRVTSNTIDASGFGVMIDPAFGVAVSGNTIRCNDTGSGIGVIADGAEISGNTVENCSEQVQMILNNSVVRENHFSGGDFPIIDVIEDGTDVYVYRNDFVLTADDAGVDAQADACIAGATVTDRCRQDMWAIPDATPEQSMWTDASLTDGSCDNAFVSRANGFDACAATAEITGWQTTNMNVGYDTAVWHSPTEETYWYYGQAYTKTLGNYWSTYTGTDTTSDGIGDTPFVYCNETRDSYPLVKPFSQYLDRKPAVPDDEDASAGIATSPALNAGDSATLHFTGTAMQTVTITAADGTGRILLTVDQAGTGPDGLTGPVYQYLSAQLSGMTDDDIREADFSFRVPAAWLKAEGLLPVDIALWRFHDGAWQELSTSIIREEGGWAYFEATTPGFSTFAIAGGAIANLVMETDASETGGERADVGITVVAGHANETGAEPEPPVTVAVPEVEFTGTQPENATTPQESPVGQIPLIAGAAGAALLLRRRE